MCSTNALLKTKLCVCKEFILAVMCDGPHCNNGYIMECYDKQAHDEVNNTKHFHHLLSLLLAIMASLIKL